VRTHGLGVVEGIRYYIHRLERLEGLPDHGDLSLDGLKFLIGIAIFHAVVFPTLSPKNFCQSTPPLSANVIRRRFVRGKDKNYPVPPQREAQQKAAAGLRLKGGV